MNCSSCKITKISPEIEPFGGYFCSKEHLQCIECYTLSKGLCRICGSVAKFVQMNYNSPKSSKEPINSKDQSNCNVFSQEMFNEIETQSRISKEHLSINDSKEYLVSNTENCDKSEKGMEILFVGAKATENSVFLIDNSVERIKVHDISIKELKQTVTKTSRDNNCAKKENIFLFDEDVNNAANNRNISDIRFMDSTESLQNSVFRNRSQHLSGLSVKVLKDYETQNTSTDSEVVKKYLNTYNSTALDDSPSYNCPDSECDFKCLPKREHLEMKTVSVSTESEPSLKSTCIDTDEEKNICSKFKTPDFLIMQAMGVPRAEILNDKDVKTNNDLRLENILKTLKEDPKITKFSEKLNLTKLTTNTSTKQQQEKLHHDQQFSEKENKNALLLKHFLNAYRAVYKPPNPLQVPVKHLNLLSQGQSIQQEHPLAQFETISCSSAMAKELLQNQTKLSALQPVPAYTLNIPRSPVQCPESSCQRMIFVSDFNKHLVVDHSHLPMERISPFQCKNFFLDGRLVQCGTSKCHLLYLMRDKITNLGSSEYKDFLPILVMATRISLHEMCGLRDKTNSLEFFLIWVTGIVPEEFPISVVMTVWSRSGKIPKCHVVYSGQMYSIRNSQRALDVWQSGRMLLLSEQEIDVLTCGGREMLNVQLSAH